MDPTTTRPSRHSPPGPVSQAPHAKKPSAAVVRARPLPAAGSRPPEPPGGGIDFEKVGKNAVTSAVTLGSCFGTMSALNSAVRATPGMSKPVKVLTGLLPSASVFPTPWVEDGLRAALDTSATLPIQPTLAHDAVAGASLFLFNAACLRSASIPKFPPATPAGMAANVIQATAASLIAGAASELTAQGMNIRDAQAGEAPEPPAHIDNPRKPTGRLLSQVPAAALQTGIALAGKPLPPSLSLLPLSVVTGGWSLRRVLIPEQAGQASSPASAPPASPSVRENVAWWAW